MTTTTSYDIFIETVKAFSTSQGYYSRLLKRINEMDFDELEKLKDEINQMDFRDAIDVVFYLEQ